MTTDKKQEETKTNKSWWKKATKYSGEAATIVGFLGLLWSGVYWIEYRIDTKVSERTAPFENLLSGISLIQDEEYDEAVEELEKAFDTFIETKQSEKRLISVIDQYLIAIVNAEDITAHEPDFNKIYKKIGDIPKYGWHYHQLGWYYLRTNNLELSKKNFERALAKYRESEKNRESADTYWALAMVHLAEGLIPKATAYTVEAQSRNPLVYSTDLLIKDRAAMSKDPWFRRLMRIYPSYEFSFNAWMDTLEGSQPDKRVN